MAKKQQGLTQVQYARTRGISTRYVRTLTRRGIVVVMPNGKIDGPASDRMRQECIAPRMPPVSTDSSTVVDIEKLGWLADDGLEHDVLKRR